MRLHDVCGEKKGMRPRLVEAILEQDIDEVSDGEEGKAEEREDLDKINIPHHNWPKHAFQSGKSF